MAQREAELDRNTRGTERRTQVEQARETVTKTESERQRPPARQTAMDPARQSCRLTNNALLRLILYSFRLTNNTLLRLILPIPVDVVESGRHHTKHAVHPLCHCQSEHSAGFGPGPANVHSDG